MKLLEKLLKWVLNHTNKVALINSDLGTNIADVSDNLEHQKSVEHISLGQRRSISSVSIDEEVADLMRFQRSFSAIIKSSKHF